MKTKYFKGVMVPVTTPFDEKGNFIVSEFQNHIERLIAAGVNALLVPSGTGEFANLTFDQRIEITRVATEQVKKRIPVVSLISDCSTEQVLRLARMVKEAGADEVMLTPPYYYHLNQRTLFDFFTEIADNCGMPLWIYHQPGETKLTVEPETVVALAKNKNIVGIKAAGGEDMLYITRLAYLLRDNKTFSILNGEDFDFIGSLAIGCDGAVSSLGNVIPQEMVALYNAVQNSDIERARELHTFVYGCFDAMVMVNTGAYQSAVKTVLKAQGYYSTNIVKKPFLTIIPEEQKMVLKKAKDLNLF